MTDHIIYTFGISTLTSSLFILTVILLRALFHRNIRMRLQYALWLLVAVRLLILPVPVVKSPLSVLRLLGGRTTPQTAQTDPVWTAFSKSADTSADASAESGAQTVPRLLQPKPLWNSSANAGWSKDRIGRLCAAAAVTGSALVFLYFFIGNIRFAVFLRRNRVRFEEDGLPLPVYLVEGLPSPFLYGHTIYLAPAMTDCPRKLSHILTHEYCHYRQGDVLWSVVRCLCVILYWWNPLVWIAASLSRQDCELSCDEAALRLLGDRERLSYGRTLIELIPARPAKHSNCSIATTMSKGGRSMKNRIRQIAASPRSTGSLCVLLAALALICFVSMSTTASTLPENSTPMPEDTEDAGIVIPEPTRIYQMQVDEEADYMDIPSLSLNEEEQTFSFHVSALSSYLIIGTYEVSNHMINARTLDEKFEYQFRIEDAATLIYISGPVSTSVGVPSEPLTPKIVPGSRFCLEPAQEQAVHDLDQAVGLAVLSFSRGRYSEAECAAEGHILLDQETSETGETIAYALTMYGEYQFQDGAFIKESGTGVIPAVITFSYDASAGYVPISCDLPEDGSNYIESIHELFPEHLWDTCTSPTDDIIDTLTEQEQDYARRYLQQLGRNAVIGEYGDRPHTLLTDAGVSVEVSNLMCEYEKYDGLWKYPYWIGNLERVEDGVRYVYAMSLDNSAHEIIYTRSIYNTDQIVETHVFDSLTGEKKQ